MDRAEPVTVLRSPAWPSLLRRLEQVRASSADDRAVGQAIERLLRPALLLEELAKDALPALGEDVLRADRLRVLLRLASFYAAYVPTENAGLANEGRLQAYEPGVLDLGALIVVALAAHRVAPPELAADFVRVVHGLALAAAPLEILGRLEPREPEVETLGLILRTVDRLESFSERVLSPDTNLSHVTERERALLPDPVELGRRRCLEAVLGWVRDQPEAAWDGAHSGAILRLLPRAVTGERVDLELDLDAQVFQRPLDLRVVLADAEGGLAELDVEWGNAPGTRTQVSVPRAAPAGWIGFSSDQWIRRSNLYRAALNERLERIEENLCLEHSPPGQSALEPPAERIPRVPLYQRANPARPRVEPAPSAAAPGLPELFTVPPRIGTNRYPGSGAPLAARRPVVLIRPQVLSAKGAHAVPLADARRALEQAARRVGLAGVELRELPWVDDELAVLPGDLESAQDPAAPRLLAALARRALFTPGQEDALWLLLVPGARKVAVHRGAAAARQVAVADLTGLGAVLEAGLVATPEATALAPRLRLALDWSETLEVAELLSEERRAGPGAPHATGLVAVSLDAAGRELSRAPLCAETLVPPVLISALLPRSAALDRVEVRDAAGAPLRTFSRPRGQAEFAVEAVGEEHPELLRWRYVHPDGLRPTVRVLVTRDGITTSAFELDACPGQGVEPPLQRLSGYDAITLGAFDGWNGAVREAPLPAKTPGPAVVLRRLPGGRYFAERVGGGEGEEVEWRLDGKRLPGGASVLELPAERAGRLELILRSTAGEVLTDSLDLRGRRRV